MKEFKFSSILGWSVSRYDLFKQCKRQYYYNYYAKYDPKISTEKINELKRMTSTALEIGNIVHDINKTLLERLQRNESKIDHKRFFDYAQRVTSDYCSCKTFREVYYQERAKIDIDNIYQKIKVSLKNFLDSERFSWLLDKALINKKNWLIEPPGYGEARINGQKAYCKVDFLFPLDTKLYIIDWKTGKPNETKHKKQLNGYAAWASYHYDRDPASIFPIISYLYPHYAETKLKDEDFEIDSFSDLIKSETKEMYRFCKDVKNNIPKEKEVFTKNVTRLCDYCNYLEFCK